MGDFGDASFPSFNDPKSSSSSHSDSYSTSSCQLSPHDKFLSSVLTSFIGSVVTGISSGWLIAFITSWICWLSAMRIIVTGSYFVYQAAWGRDLETSPWVLKMIEKRRLKAEARAAPGRSPQDRHVVGVSSNPAFQYVALDDLPPDRGALVVDGRPPSPQGDPPPLYEPGAHLLGDEESQRRSQPGTKRSSSEPKGRDLGLGLRADPPSVLGWIGWVYGALYFPVAQVLFLAANAGDDADRAGNVKLVRAIAVGVTALPLTFDTKARYAASLRKRGRAGRWAGRAFTWAHALATLGLGAVEAALLGLAWRQLGAPVFFVPAYIALSTLWMAGSFVFVPPVDGGMAPNTAGLFAAGLAMGVFAGAGTSFAAFVNMANAPTEPGLGLGAYLSCEGASALGKFAAIFP